MAAKNTGILGIQAKDQAHAQFVQTFQGSFAFRICILFQESIVQQSDNLTGGNGNFHLPFQMLIAGIYQKLQPIGFAFQVFQLDNLRLPLGAFHIIHIKGAEIAGDDPARMFGQRQFGNIPLGLLERRQIGTVRLTDSFLHILVQCFLLNQYASGWNITINKTGVVQMDLVLKFNKLFRMLHAVNIPKQRKPERLTFAFFVAFSLPVFGKLFCCFLLLCIRHPFHLVAQFLRIMIA